MSDLNETLAKIAVALGLKPSEARKLELLKKKLGELKTRNLDKVEELKDQIRAIEARLLRKKNEYDTAKGGVKRILAKEIEGIVRDLDRAEKKMSLINRNLEQVGLALEKIEELEQAQKDGVSEDDLDDLAVSLDDAFDDLRSTDKAAESLKDVTYEAPGAEPVDIEERVKDVTGAPRGKEAEGGLSQRALERMKELE